METTKIAPAAPSTVWAFLLRNKWAIGAMLLVGLGAYGYRWIFGKTPIRYATAAVQRGDVESTVVAAGILQPVLYVDVGTQTSGKLQSLKVKRGDQVTKRQLLAEIDPVLANSADPTFRFMTIDSDGEIRMDPSSVYAMQRLIGMKDRFDISFACDTDHDRHGIVTRSAGLLSPNHYLSAAICYLFQHRPRWRKDAAIGKTIVSSQMIDRVAAKLGRKLYETPVGFKWFVSGLLNGSLGFAGEESAGASFLRMDGGVWTTDKDGIVPGLLAAEVTATMGRDPGELYRELTHEFGEPMYERVDVPRTASQRELLANLKPEQIHITELAGDKVQQVLTCAPGNNAPIGGVKVITGSGWFAVRPSGTESIYKIYAESFRGSGCLQSILQQAQQTVSDLFVPAAPPPHQQTVSEAKEVWRNEGNPN